MEKHQIYAVLGFLVLLWRFHQSNALQEGEHYQQPTRQRVDEHFILQMRRARQHRKRRRALMREMDYDVLVTQTTSEVWP